VCYQHTLDHFFFICVEEGVAASHAVDQAEEGPVEEDRASLLVVVLAVRVAVRHTVVVDDVAAVAAAAAAAVFHIVDALAVIHNCLEA
jgi:hypothetical protein